MSQRQIHVLSVSESDPTVTITRTYTAGARADLSESIPVGSNQTIIWGVDVSQIKAFALVVDGALTIVFKDSGNSTIATLTFTAANKYEWTIDDPAALQLLTSDVDHLVVTNGTSGAVQLDIRCLYDPTA